MASSAGDLSPFRSIADVVYAQARRAPNKPALHRGDTAISYAELCERVGRFAAFVASRVGRGERVGILLANVPEFVVAYFGAIAAGAVAVPINNRLAPGEIGYILSDCGVAALVTTGAQHDKLTGLPEARTVTQWILVDGARPGALAFTAAAGDVPLDEPVSTSPNDVACLLYTSGTTGFPKGAMISHRNALFNAESCQRMLGYREDDVGLLTVPLFHVTGLHSQLVALFAVRATIVLQQEYETRRALELIARRRVTALFFVPAIYKLITLRHDLRSYDLSSVRLAAYGGAPMDPETIRALRDVFPGLEMHNCYGLTESSSLATVLPSSEALSRADSVGLPVPGTEAEVRDEAGGVLPRGTPGELQLRGPQIVQGYWGAPEKTRAAIRDGWLKTGDLARIDEDGFVHILDRVKDMINRGGEKVYGLEVENAIYAFPGIAEAAVVGVPHEIFGEVPVAFVAPMSGASVDPEALRAHCASRLADYKVPVAVRFVDKLPRNPGGKVLKHELRSAWISGAR
ncbi:MAG TPA: long-chain-fatty-acid--CoA ligase [Myxococcaceae bacterium]|nr:long-chain-fatty-acid--CoA ligase [Myxococcaceae bacterium]